MRNSLALLLISLTVFSQTEPTSFSLEDAVNYALLNNKYSLDSQNDVRLAELQKWQTTSTGLPQISADISWICAAIPPQYPYKPLYSSS